MCSEDWMEPRVTSLFQTIEESPIVRTGRQIARQQEYLFANLQYSQPETYSLTVVVTEFSVVDVRFDCFVTLFRVLLLCGLLEWPYEIHQMIRGTLGQVRILWKQEMIPEKCGIWLRKDLFQKRQDFSISSRLVVRKEIMCVTQVVYLSGYIFWNAIARTRSECFA
jgi:hypothetical protein